MKIPTQPEQLITLLAEDIGVPGLCMANKKHDKHDKNMYVQSSNSVIDSAHAWQSTKKALSLDWSRNMPIMWYSTMVNQ